MIPTQPTPAATTAGSVAESSLLCRFCGNALSVAFADLGSTPLCESYLKPEDCQRMEPFYPLCAYVCSHCFLVQVPQVVSASEIFSEYAYFSSYSESWLRHAKAYVEAMIPRVGLDERSSVIEVASNDGYLLQYFVERHIPVLGIEPARNVARVAIGKGVPTLVAFFGDELGAELQRTGHAADLLLGNNVLAHVPDLNSFVRGLKLALKSTGMITMEFPHLEKLIEGRQFDTIYHEHFCYFSLTAVERVFAAHGLTIFDVDELPTHGGSLRIYARHQEDDSRPVSSAVIGLREREAAAGVCTLDYYRSFSREVEAVKRRLLSCLIEIKDAGSTVVAYGAPGKGNTLLNFCGIRTDFLDYAVDRNPYKHGRFLPGTRIPIYPPDRIRETKPDYLLILPWNLREEIMLQMDYVRGWGAKFIVPIPDVRILN